MPGMPAPAIKSHHLCLCSLSQKEQHPDGFGPQQRLKADETFEKVSPAIPKTLLSNRAAPQHREGLAEHPQVAFITFHLAKRSTKPEGTGTSATANMLNPCWPYPATTLSPGLQTPSPCHSLVLGTLRHLSPLAGAMDFTCYGPAFPAHTQAPAPQEGESGEKGSSPG